MEDRQDKRDITIESKRILHARVKDDKDKDSILYEAESRFADIRRHTGGSWP